MPLSKCPASSRAEGSLLGPKRRPEDDSPAPSVPTTKRSKPAASSTTAPEATRDVLDNFPIGRLDSYKILDKIGAGAFGHVWKARHRRTGRKVAIKSVSAGGNAALLREAALLTACAGNPGVVELHEVVRGGGGGVGVGTETMDGKQLYLVMEYAGPSLRSVVGARRHAGRPLLEDEARRVMRQLLRGVKVMHERGVVYCDLKPGNVLVGKEDGRGRGRSVKICDLGLAMSATVPPPDTSGPVHGTLWYMAPEQLTGDTECRAPVDLWSLGCVMAELVAGKPIFQGSDVFEQLGEIVHLLGIPDEVSLMSLGVSPSTPSHLRDAVQEEQLSPAGFDVLRGLLEFDPRDRLTSAAALQMPWFTGKEKDDDDAPSKRDPPI